jgi:hypothetical protein
MAYTPAPEIAQPHLESQKHPPPPSSISQLQQKMADLNCTVAPSEAGTDAGVAGAGVSPLPNCRLS